MSDNPGQIIILNGTPRAGKSSIARVIQYTFEGVWMPLGVDALMRMTPARYLPGIGLRPGGERLDLEPWIARMYATLYDSIAAYSRLGLHVVVDVGHHDAYSRPLGILADCARRLEGLPALFVGVRCPVGTILERRREAGGYSLERRWAELWERAVHDPGIYDLEVDTSQLSPEACAQRIQDRLLSGASGTVLSRLARSGPGVAGAA